MRVTVIGCSPAWPNPGGAQSGYLVEGVGGRLLLDCGPGVLARLRATAPWPAVDAIVITHFHLDHWGDLVPWIFGASFGPGRGVPQPALWLPPGGAATLRSFGRQLAFAERLDRAFELHEYAEATSFSCAGFEVTPERLAHYEEQTFGLRVAEGAATCAYSGDTGPCDRLAELARDADLFLCEATLAEPEPAERGHLTEQEAVAAFDASGARRLVLIHRPAELVLADASLELARDGDSFELS
ncbi:MAG: MBL fold metallo-hydrolase [Gaiellaceae bacterium]